MSSLSTSPAVRGQNAVGIIDASQDTEIDGPQALTTDENGEIYLLDQVNGRIVGFDPGTPAGATSHSLNFRINWSLPT